MKYAWLYLTALLVGAMPLAAAAADYGPNRPLLAAENGAPQVPGAPTRATPMSAMPKPDVPDADGSDATNVALSLPQSGSPPPVPGAARPGQTATRNDPRSKMGEGVTAPSPASWQSLLPGSIQ